MRISRKTSRCLNCEYPLDQYYNYCPNCGQGNHDDNVSFGTLVGDFFSTYFAIDSKFGRSIKPFFIKPGYLTNRYTAGKRASYAHPIRLYLIISIFYFFTITLAAKYFSKENSENYSQNYSVNTESTGKLKSLHDEVEGVNDSTRLKIISSLSQLEKGEYIDEVAGEDKEELIAFIEDLDHDSQMNLRRVLGDSAADNLEIITQEKIAEEKNKMAEKAADTSKFILERISEKEIKRLDKSYDLTDKQIYDSLQLKNLSSFEELVAKQYIRVQRADEEQVIGYITNNLPLMMLLLIPLFAVILKLLYIRRNELYIKHLVHALHLHSFAYLIYGICLLLVIYALEDSTFSTFFNLGAFLLVSTYAYISFLKVYKQHWFKTLIKFNIVGFAYFSIIMIFFVAEMIVSLLLF
ncbi:MAG: DUF3667 domain-containing protein [Fulvivirga sp.]|nr:DUF3667 domain-containing protein [Fulvivirga sp.]